MDLWQLKIFTKVVETMSFSKASEQIYLSQPTVSSHIKELEEHFGCKLLDRLGKTSVPTKAGEILYNFAKQLLSLKDEAESTIHDFLGNIKGSLIIGGSTIPAGYIIPKLIGQFVKRFPGISIELSAGNTTQIINDIEKGRIEIAIVGANINNSNITREKLIDDEMKLVILADHKWAKKKSISWANLLNEPFIAREKGSGTWQSILKSISQAGFDTNNLNIVATFGSTASVIQGILNNVGISILSTIAVQDEIKAGRLKALPVDDLDLNRFFYLIHHSKRTLSPTTREFAKFAKQSS